MAPSRATSQLLKLLGHSCADGKNAPLFAAAKDATDETRASVFHSAEAVRHLAERYHEARASPHRATPRSGESRLRPASAEARARTRARGVGVGGGLAAAMSRGRGAHHRRPLPARARDRCATRTRSTPAR